MKELIERIECAEADKLAQMERLFIEAGCHVFANRQRNPLWSKYCSLVEEEAWLSAAEMLVPEGFDWQAGWCAHEGAYARVNRSNVEVTEDNVFLAATPALALAAAALKARGE